MGNGDFVWQSEASIAVSCMNDSILFGLGVGNVPSLCLTLTCSSSGKGTSQRSSDL